MKKRVRLRCLPSGPCQQNRRKIYDCQWLRHGPLCVGQRQDRGFLAMDFQMGLPSEFEQTIHSQLGDEAPHSVEPGRNAIATPPDRNQPTAAYLSGKMDVSATTRVCLNVEQLAASRAHLPLTADLRASARGPHSS